MKTIYSARPAGTENSCRCACMMERGFRIGLGRRKEAKLFGRGSDITTPDVYFAGKWGDDRQQQTVGYFAQDTS